jgi:hypothetical protein
VPTLAVVLTGGIGVLVAVAFVAAVAFGRDTDVSPGDRVAVVQSDGPAGLTVLAGRCEDERVKAVELRTPDGVSLWRIESARGAIDRRFLVGQDPPPFSFATVTPLQALPAGPLEAEITVDKTIDGEVFDRAHLDEESAPDAPCGNKDVGVVALVFMLGALGVVVAYGVMVRRYLSAR